MCCYHVCLQHHGEQRELSRYQESLLHIRDIRNENNSAEQELEAYFNVGVEEEAVVEETVVEAAVEEITEKEDKTVEEKKSEA